ncbi:TSC22 domain family protein 1-like isoform X2 [Mytilus californianus]|uniref:TSC22 domain family protein 1-like isoform X2 n=1 Tax=Mytilus californianus TaxID=6549 RepID=UPI002246717E|nr:TSC22 domain family protein 1-like isoform X2 [Mytilus californianus]
MNMAANSDKMAVTDNQSIPIHGSDSREDTDMKLQGKSTNDGNYKKKSTFKITSVTKSYHGSADLSNDADHDIEHDSMDDLDETVESHTEDASSEILDISKHTDGGEPASPMEEETSDHAINSGISNKEVNIKTEQMNSSSNVKEINVKEKEKTEQQGPHPTRFKVVKIETREPFKRGRWRCQDTLDIPAPDKSDTKINIVDSNVGVSNTSGTTHNVSSVEDPSKNPAKSVTVIQGENRENFHIDNSSTIRQTQPNSQLQIVQTPNSNIPSNVAQQVYTHPVSTNFQNGTGHSQALPNVNSSHTPGQTTMQTGDTTFIYTGQIPSTIQNIAGSNVDKSLQYNKEQYVGSDNVIQNVDNAELNSDSSKTSGAHKMPQNSMNIEVQQGAILTPQSVAEVVGMIPSPQEEDRSKRNFSAINPLTPGGRGSSTVAIDNKIEQAMDLVKSHLMYAVREEVEVLKEQIKELMDKNQQLEYENQILKNSASPETLSKLSSPSSSS